MGLKKQKVYGDARKAARAAYNTAKKHAKRVVWLAKQDAAETAYANVDHKGPEIHRIAKQMQRQNQGPVLLTLLRHVAWISANGIAAFIESCSPIG